MHKLTVRTRDHSQMVELTDQLRDLLATSKLSSGTMVVYVPHTTAGVTINENADPDVVHDMLEQLAKMVPWDQPFYQHGEGNSAAHVKASMMGSSVTILIQESRLMLGRWQGVWFCEFDGPRTREVYVSLRSE